MSGTYYGMRCTACAHYTVGVWELVARHARDHETTSGHRVQVYPKAEIVAPLPRELWA